MNSGYIGYSRSVRSQKAIEDYELPLSLINKSIIESFLNEYEEEFPKNELSFLQKLTVKKWNFIAKEHTERSSWHHTSNYFNKTNHYDLLTVAKKAIELKEEIDILYKENQTVKVDYSFGVMQVQIWGGSRKHPKLIGYEIVAGVIIGDWLYFKESHNKHALISRYKASANKVNWINEFDNYDGLIKKHKDFKNTKRVFNEIIKEKIK